MNELTDFFMRVAQNPNTKWFDTTASNNTVCCRWCGKDLSTASGVTYLNGNQAVCDLCLMKAR